MEIDESRVESIFFAALEIESAEERTAYLHEACENDDRLRRRVGELLDAQPKLDGFIEGNAAEFAGTINMPPIAERPGTVIGPYKLLQEIGEGGMGTVFMAEQMRPVKRRVAVKVIKQGMDTRQFIARFEAERQALAMMDHPNIARVLDAGCTDSGRPYFVMELVKGVPITEFCDENHLTTRDRLKLFVSVCQAVQHAHQKGIIHRDLKPSNVLVTLYDDCAVPKIIDFGVAKATNQQLTEKTLFTRIGQIVGTWEYMSPEQAVLNQLDVDTRTDVYSLGVILYELLTGVTPLESKRLRSAAIDETLRLIREEEPPKPSTRVSSLGDTATATAAYRGTNATALAKMLRGDMDWIVMKSLEKNRSRRYDTANALVADLNRCLEGDPIEARPPSTAYRFRKTVSRHRVALATTAVVMVALLAGIVTSTWFAVRAVTAERAARAALESLREEFIDRAFDAAFSGDLREAREAIQKARLAKAPDDLLQTLDGLAVFFDGRPDEAIDLLEKATANNPDSISAFSALWWAYRHAGCADKMCEIETQIIDREWSPVTQFEDLFLCLTQAVQGPPEAIKGVIERLDSIITERNRWGVAYAIRATAWMEYAMESKDIADFRRAVSDIEKAEELLPDSPFVRTMALYVLTTAFELAEHEGSEVDAAQWRRRVQEIAAEFDNRTDYVEARARIAVFYYRTGQEERGRALENELVSPAQVYGVGGLSPWAALHFRRKTPNLKQMLRTECNDAEAISCRTDAEICLALVLMENSVSGRKEAMEIYCRLRKQDLPDPYLLGVLDIPLLLGRLDETTSLVAQLLESRELSREWRWYRYVVEYYAGILKEDELIRRAEPFSNAGCMAHYAVAMKSLAQGQREKAKHHFDLVVETGRIGYWNYHWAQAFQQRMREDPTWPFWIPADKMQ